MNISRSDRRVLAIGAVAVATLLAAGRGIPALRMWGDAREQAALAAIANLSRTRRAIARGDDARQSVTRLHELERLRADSMLSVATPALADARLARVLAEVADEAGVELVAIQAVAGPQRQLPRGHHVVRGRARISGGFDAIAFFLAGVESATPRLVVRTLTLNQGDARPGLGAETVRAELVVEALAVTGAAARP